MRYTTGICFIVLCSLFYSSQCFAHKVRIFAWGEGDTIHTESRFSGGRPAQNATVTVMRSSSGEELLRGITDQQGLFQFPAPDSSIKEINIVVNSGDGHKNSWLYQLQESEATSEVQQHTHSELDVTSNTAPIITPLTREQFSQIIDETLEKKLAPIRHQLARATEQEPDFKDILGGIGYILGLAGIVAYMKSKKQ